MVPKTGAEIAADDKRVSPIFRANPICVCTGAVCPSSYS